MKWFVKMKKILVLGIFAILFEQQIVASNFSGFIAYGDEYGYLATTYSMGDYVSGFVNPENTGFATYYPNAGVQFDCIKDANKYGLNTGNLFNALGMLYAGWATFNISNVPHTKKHWLTTYRQAGGGSRTYFDNFGGLGPIALFDTSKQPNIWPAVYWTISNDKQINLNYVNFNNFNMFGQYFGARIAHILGAVVNDVPSKVSSTTPSMQSGRPKPQMAVMTGATNSVPAGLTTPSTAHFGTIQNFLSTHLSISPSASPTIKLAGKYLTYHILQAVQRLASVCSYEMSPTNLIHMTRANVGSITSYDQGVIVAIQNNTGDPLTINQISTAATSQVGSLDTTGTSNLFLHTASLMPASTAAGSQDPVPGNMIEIADATTGSSAYVQVVSGTQLQGLLNGNSGFNTIFTAVDLANENAILTKANEPTVTNLYFSYNQVSSSENYNPQGQYLLLTNFNTSTLSSTDQNITMYRMQAVDISQFDGVPFTVTLQINEKKSILYPSVVSIKTLLLQNPYDQQRSDSGNTYYCGIPPLLISESIINSGITGLKAHYGIWFLSYISALTEFMYQGSFGDMLGALDKTIGLFDVSVQQPPARVVIDASGNLKSGEVLSLVNDTSAPYQSQATYMSLMGCDVVDIGSDYHKDIPILNLYKGSTLGSVVANTSGGKWINFSVSFGSPLVLSDAPTTFAQGYSVPYNNVMLFSLSAADMTAGVTGELSQTSAGNYELIFKDQTSKVLGVQKVFLDTSIQNQTQIKIQFLNSADTGWTSSTSIPSIVSTVGVGKTNTFELTYGVSGTTNTLKAGMPKVPSVNLKSITNWTELTLATTAAGIASIPVNSVHVTDTPLAYFNINIGSSLGYAFFSNPWTQPNVVPGFKYADIQDSDWKAGVQIVLLGLDANNNIMFDLTQTMPKSMALFVFNSTGEKLLKTVTFDPLTSATSLGNANTFDTNSMQLGCDSAASSSVGMYPQNFVIQYPGSKVTQTISPVAVKKQVKKATGALAVHSPTTTLVASPATRATQKVGTTTPAAVEGSSVATTKLGKKIKTTGALAVTSPATSSPATSLAVASKATTETVTPDEINTLKTQIQSLDTQVKKAITSATDENKKTLKHLSEKTKKLLKKVKPSITVEEFKKARKKYTKIQKKFNTIIPAS